MIKVVIPALCVALVGSVAHAESAARPGSFVGESLGTLIHAYGAPTYETSLADGRTVSVFEVTSYETYETATRMQQAERRIQAGSHSRYQQERYAQRGLMRQVSAGAGSTPGLSPVSHTVQIDQFRPVPVTCRVAAVLDNQGQVQDVQLNDQACRTLNLR